VTSTEQPFRGGLVEKLGQPQLEIQVCDRRGSPVASELAALDTGATWSVLPERLMGPIGFAPHDCHPYEVNTASGRVQNLLAHDRLGMVEVHWGPYRVPVLPMFSHHAERVLLGVSDFMREFTIVFDPVADVIDLHPHPNTPRVAGAGPVRGLVVPGLGTESRTAGSAE
jgi:hypothetical protein